MLVYFGVSVPSLKMVRQIQKTTTILFRHNSTMSTYALSRDLSIPLIAGICTALQIKSFAKWSKSNCIIKDLIKSIPKMPYFSWTKESRTLYKKNQKI